MTLKVRILRCSRRLFIILVSLTMTWFSEKMLISTRCIHGFMSNLIKKSWTDSIDKLDSIVHWQCAVAVVVSNFQTFFHYRVRILICLQIGRIILTKTKLASQTNCPCKKIYWTPGLLTTALLFDIISWLFFSLFLVVFLFTFCSLFVIIIT